MARYSLFQKGPEDFYGSLSTLSVLYKKEGSTVTSGVNTYPTNKFEYPLEYPLLSSTLNVVDSDSKRYQYFCNITLTLPKCVDVSIKKIDYANELTDLTVTSDYIITTSSETEDDYTVNIQINNIFSDTFKSTNEAMEDIMYSTCLVYNFKAGTSFVNISTKSYNVEIGEESDEYIDDLKINYAFMTKPYDVQSFVRIPMRFGDESANVFGIYDQLLIETFNPSRSSGNVKGYYLGRSSSTISDDDAVAIRNGNMDYLNIYTINNFLNQTERDKLDDGEDVNLYLWMRYSAPRQATPISARKIRIIKAY